MHVTHRWFNESGPKIKATNSIGLFQKKMTKRERPNDKTNFQLQYYVIFSLFIKNMESIQLNIFKP